MRGNFYFPSAGMGSLPNVTVNRLAVLGIHLNSGLLHLARRHEGTQSRRHLTLGHISNLSKSLGINRILSLHNASNHTVTGSSSLKLRLGGLVALTPLGVNSIHLRKLGVCILGHLLRDGGTGYGTQKFTLGHGFYLSPFYGLSAVLFNFGVLSVPFVIII